MAEHDISAPVTEREIDMRAIVEAVEGVSLDEPVVYIFGNREFRERTPYPA